MNLVKSSQPVWLTKSIGILFSCDESRLPQTTAEADKETWLPAANDISGGDVASVVALEEGRKDVTEALCCWIDVSVWVRDLCCNRGNNKGWHKPCEYFSSKRCKREVSFGKQSRHTHTQSQDKGRFTSPSQPVYPWPLNCAHLRNSGQNAAETQYTSGHGCTSTVTTSFEVK